MKKIITLIAIQLLLLNTTFAQRTSSDIFIKCFLREHGDRTTICFTVKKEINVSYYAVEAGSDTAALEIIARVSPKGNTVMPVSYEVPMDTPPATGYRVRRVDMNGKLSYSPVLRHARRLVPSPAATADQELASNPAAD
jgi:hypothetical protein